MSALCGYVLIRSHSLTEGDKSATQKLSDATGSGANDAESQGKTYLESAQETAGNVASSASETISGKNTF